jgi:8-oxo-dGTP pyrophosphatase MutT (NUDIX family)
MGAWINRGERTVYESPWFKLNLADVELPDGRHLDHYLLRQHPVVVAACLDGEGRVLMLWRHRFIPDTYGYELPAGMVEAGEDLETAAAREALEETGWRSGPLKHLLTVEPAAGFSDAVHHVFYTESAEYVGDPEDAVESDRIEWVALADVPALIAQGKIRAANTVAALLQLHSRLGLSAAQSR